MMKNYAPKFASDGLNFNLTFFQFGQYFTMRAYKDDQLTSEIAADNTVHIGDQIWVFQILINFLLCICFY